MDIATLFEVLIYNEKTGDLTWRYRDRKFFKSDAAYTRWNKRYAFKPAFGKKADGYRSGMIFRKMFRAHKVAWAMHFGHWPADEVDHINGNRSDNRIENLRVVSHRDNARNKRKSRANKSGHVGVSEYKPGKWRAYINTDTGMKHLGVFGSLEDAVSARMLAQTELGYHPNHGRAA